MTEALRDYVLLYEYLPSDDPLDEVITATAPASNFEEDWTVVANSNLTEERAVEDIPRRGSQTTVRPDQALIFLGERHAGIIGAGASEFYDDRFDVSEDTLRTEFMDDVRSEFD
ncbi:hypothetical protein G6M89_20570 [Natronolimnobius sp. AArcel1]|uniref:hypothetical protein n=1 Tax=Natronolimnobius sp. AArcel1 TaxID=1679093 RepID=UPI0013EA9685|nr:hypothetical protein [Natronolimnobius sp. AArcel1]NGM71360.1 hypothetical protein [Natronolimnobius sp. AArcel1]